VPRNLDRGLRIARAVLGPTWLRIVRLAANDGEDVKGIARLPADLDLGADVSC